MTASNDLDELIADAELPLGHPGGRFDDTPLTPETVCLRDSRKYPCWMSSPFAGLCMRLPYPA